MPALELFDDFAKMMAFPEASSGISLFVTTFVYN